MTRINCHSAFRHYEMFHSGGCGGGNYGSIFNTTYNINCGGHGGFWSGVGYGLGNMLGGMFGGMFNGGGMFGMGGNMGNMFGGFGFPSFGGGFGNFGNWGNIWGGGNQKSSGNCNCNCGNKGSEKTDDAAKSEARSAKKSSSAKDGANATKGTTETKAPDAKTAEVVKNATPANATSSTEETASVKNDEVAGSTDAAKAAENKAASTEDATQKEPSVKIDGKDIALKDLKPDDILKLTKDQIANLNQEQANQLLDKLEINEDMPISAEMLTNKAALRLLALAGRRVKLAENKGERLKDSYIWGTISDVSEDDSKPVSYTVDCNNEKSTHKNTYQFTQTALNEKSFKVTVKQFADGSGYKNPNKKEVTYSAEGNNKYLTRNGEPFVTK